MQLSNRLTFSLASLILMVIMGLVLLPATTVYADNTFGIGTITSKTGGNAWKVGTAYTADAAVVSLPRATGDHVHDITYTLTNTDVLTGAGLTVTLPSGDANDASPAANGKISGTPTKPISHRQFTLTATAADHDPVVANFNFEIQALPSFPSPLFGKDESPDKIYKTGTTVNLVIPKATDADSSTLTYALSFVSAKPAVDSTQGVLGNAFDGGDLKSDGAISDIAGLSWNSVLREIRGISTTATAAANFIIRAGDGDNNLAYATFSIETKVSTSPVFDPADDIVIDDAKEGVAITRTKLPNAEDADGDTVTYNVTALNNALPLGLEVVDNNAGLAGSDPVWVLQGTPGAGTAQTEMTYKWTAMDGDADSTDNSVDIKITIAAADNTAPVFADATTTRSVPENTAAGTNIGAPVTATDADTGDTLTYSLSGTDVASFAIVEASGQLQTKAALDYETKASYTVTVTATDAASATDTIDVTINITNDASDDPADISQPTNVTAVPQNDGTVMVTWAWTGANATETAALAGFTVAWNPSMDVAADKRSYTIPAAQLTAGQSTTVSVLARATAGSGYATPAAGTGAPSAVTPVDTNALRFAPNANIGDLEFTVGTKIGTTAIPYIQLPQAYGGSVDKTYSLHKGLPGKIMVASSADVTAANPTKDIGNGLSVDFATLRLMGTPVHSDEVDEKITYIWRVANVQRAGDVEVVRELSFTITVLNTAPVYPATALTITGTVGTAITPVDASADDPGDTLKYSWDVNQADLGLKLNTSTGMITGTPLKVYTATHVLTATDSGQLTATRSVSITITDAGSPTVAISVISRDTNGKHELRSGAAVFGLDFSEPLAKSPSVSRLQNTDFDIRSFTTEAAYATYLKIGVGGTVIPSSSASLSDAESVIDEITGIEHEEYTLTVPAGTDPQIILIKLDAAQVTDLAGNILSGSAASLMAKFDTVAPTVVITPGYFNAAGTFVAAATGEPMAKLAFEFAFSEELTPGFTTSNIEGSPTGANFTFQADAKATAVMGKPNAFTVIATIIDKNAPTTVQIERLEVSDAAKNKLQADVLATYTPKKTAPVATVTATSPFRCDITGNTVTVTITDTEAIKAGEAIAASEITVSKGWKIKTGSFSGAAAAAGAKSVSATFNVIRNDVETPADRTWLGVTTVSVTVAANAVMDSTAQGNAASVKTVTAGPVITIRANEYIVVIRESAAANSHLNQVSSLFLGDYNVRAGDVKIQHWDCMPDLGLIFDTTLDASPGIGGGGLMVLQSPDHTGAAIAKGTVGISEIMWSEDRGIPFGLASNLEHAREQWIELHNTNAFDVKVTLFELIRAEAYHTNNYGEIDIMSNYDIGGRWDVKGSDGNSEYGKDFVSMQRRTPEAAKNYAHGEKQGRNAGHWSAATAIYLTRRANLAGTGQIPVEDLNYDFMGSPGRNNSFSAPGPITRTDVKHSPVIFNEIANRTNSNRYYEWIELRNVTASNVNLRNYNISYITAVGTETTLYEFPNNDNIQIAANGILLLTDTDPKNREDHPVAMDNPNVKYVVTDFIGNGLPDDGEFVLVLRHPEAHDKAGTAKAKQGTPDRVVDLVGYDPNLASAGIHSGLWPFKVFGAPLAHNKIDVETVHHRQHVIDPDKATHGDKKPEHAALRDVGYSGIGYKRLIPGIPAHGGTPGYANNVTKVYEDANATVSAAPVTISEIMYQTGNRLPQWIELYNSSKTEVVQLDDWTLMLENADDVSIRAPRVSVKLAAKLIQPNQTILIVASTTGNNSDHFPDSRVIDIWGNGLKDKDRLEIDNNVTTRRNFKFLSETAFKITLKDKAGKVVDTVGNRGADWDLPEEGENRSSLIRRYDDGVARDGTLPAWSGPGSLKPAKDPKDAGMDGNAGWVLATSSGLYETQDDTYYGNVTDEGSPGYRGGGPVPVSLSKFRPERLDDGSIVVRWITDSELNNAGFNILRSETKDGEYTQLNTKLIAGQGTTSERTTYTYSDTSAKPNVVYYYQIQDVSLDGKVTTLRVNRLKGHISAAGKATTTWAELKALQ